MDCRAALAMTEDNLSGIEFTSAILSSLRAKRSNPGKKENAWGNEYILMRIVFLFI
jgi:hypothetical protein